MKINDIEYVSTKDITDILINGVYYKKKPLFFTDDEVDIYKGQPYFFIENEMIKVGYSVGLNHYLHDKKFFSRSKAQEYLDSQNRKELLVKSKKKDFKLVFAGNGEDLSFKFSEKIFFSFQDSNGIDYKISVEGQKPKK